MDSAVEEGTAQSTTLELEVLRLAVQQRACTAPAATFLPPERLPDGKNELLHKEAVDI